MTIDFYNLDQTALQHSIEVLSLTEESDKVTGLDFFATESKTCKITFFEDSWSLSNLLNLGSSSFIANSTIMNMPFMFTKSRVHRVYYVERDKIKYDKKKRKFEITGMDLIGLLIKLTNDTKNYDAGEYSAIDLLTDTIDEILTQDSIVYGINNSAASQFMDVQNYEISLAIDDKTYFDADCFWDESNAGFSVEGLFKYIGTPSFRMLIVLANRWPDDGNAAINGFPFSTIRNKMLSRIPRVEKPCLQSYPP